MKDFLFSNINDFRYERKFYLEGVSRDDVELLLKLHPAIFSEIYNERIINSIYFDSLDLEHYFDNINGVSRRIKVRIRWYGNMFGFIEKPTLELKLKHNLYVGKLLYRLNPFTMDNTFDISTIRKIFNSSSLDETLRCHLMELGFSLLNRYKRKYFLSANKKYRITIDSDMKIFKLAPYQNNFLCEFTDYSNTILELKYNETDDEFVDEISTFFPFRMTRSSKYVDGITKLHQ